MASTSKNHAPAAASENSRKRDGESKKNFCYNGISVVIRNLAGPLQKGDIMRRTFALVLIVQLMLGVVAGCARGGMRGDIAPEITVRDWFNSEPITLKSLRGKIVVLEFWATWCPPCRTSIPHLNKLNEEYKDKGVVIIGITQESKGKVKSFMKRTPMEYIVGAGGGNTSQTYGVRGIPHAFIIDTKGIVRWNGHPMSGLGGAIEKQLKETPPILLSQKALKVMERFIAEAEKALKKNNYLVAIEKAQKIKGTEKVPVEIRVKADAVLGKVTVKGEKELAEAKVLIKAEAYLAANKILTRVQRTYVGLPISGKAAELLKNMSKNP